MDNQVNRGEGEVVRRRKTIHETESHLAGNRTQNSFLHSYREAWRKTTVLLRHCSEDWKQTDKGHRVLKWHGSAPSVKSAYYCRIDTKQGPYRRQAWLILTESPSTWEVEAGGLKIVLGSIYQDWVHSGQQNSKANHEEALTWGDW